MGRVPVPPPLPVPTPPRTTGLPSCGATTALGLNLRLAHSPLFLSVPAWRDTKTAVLVFNRNADFTAVLAKIVETMPGVPNFKRDLGKSDETTFHYVFAQPNDASREIIVTVLAFDIPTAPADVKDIGVGKSSLAKAATI
jgi:hypothetical protein